MAMSDDRKRPANLLETPLNVVNLGLEGFAQDLERHGVPVIHVDWSPPARGDARLADLLSKLDG
jgi:FdrA protein